MNNNDFQLKFDQYNQVDEAKYSSTLFDNLIWLTTDEAATFLRKTSHALRQLVYKGKIRPRKFAGRLYFKRTELDTLIDTSFY